MVKEKSVTEEVCKLKHEALYNELKEIKENHIAHLQQGLKDLRKETQDGFDKADLKFDKFNVKLDAIIKIGIGILVSIVVGFIVNYFKVVI